MTTATVDGIVALEPDDADDGDLTTEATEPMTGTRLWSLRFHGNPSTRDLMAYLPAAPTAPEMHDRHWARRKEDVAKMKLLLVAPTTAAAHWAPVRASPTAHPLWRGVTNSPTPCMMW